MELPTKFVTAPSNSLFCPLCRLLFQEPVISTKCGHTFCKSCVVGSITHAVCPVDDTDIVPTDVVANRAVNGQLDDLLIWCRHALYRVDSEEDFRLNEEGCKEQISIKNRTAHEDQCPMAWIPCPNSSNRCGKFRKVNFDAHLLECPYHSCKFVKKGCEYSGRKSEVEKHELECVYSTTTVEWDELSSHEQADTADGLQTKYLVKAVKNLNERVTSLEKSKDEILQELEKCNSNVTRLCVQMEKLTRTIENMRYTQHSSTNSIKSYTSCDTSVDYRRTVSSIGLNTFSNGSGRTRSISSSGHTHHMFSFSEPKLESWKMPLSFKVAGTFRGHSGIIRALASKGKYVFSGGSDMCIKVWDIHDKHMKDSRGCIATLAGHTGDIHAMCISGRYLYSAGGDKSIKVWDIENLALLASREDAHSDIIGAIASTGKYIFSGSYSSINVWRVATLELLHSVADIHHWVRAFAIAPKRKSVYSGSHNRVHIWSADEPFASVGELTHTHGSVYSLAVTNSYLIIGTYNQNTHLYNVVTHQHVKVLNAHLGIINDVMSSPSGNFLFTASYDNTVVLWDLVKVLPIHILDRHEGSVNCMTLRGDMLFTGSEDRAIKVYMYYHGLAFKNIMVPM